VHTELLSKNAGKIANAEVPLADLESTLQSLGYEMPDLGGPLRDSGADVQCRLVVRKSDEGIVAAVLMGFDGVAGWIHGLWVSHEHQKRGHGRALILEAEKWLVSHGADRIHLQVRYTNLSALGFCDRVGYRFYDAVVLAKSVRSLGNQEEG
jgi:ribosomal protein S18 acetylase RimI-like enzyme